MQKVFNFLSSEGVVLSNASSFRESIEQLFKDKYGEELDTSSETLIGVFIDAMTLALKNTADTTASTANLINPMISYGTHLESIGALLDIEKRSATQSVVRDVEFMGKPFTVIPKGSIVATEEYQFKTTSQLVINKEGLATAEIVAVDDGPIPCGENEIKYIRTPVLGWETVKNTKEAELGRAKESDAEYRVRYYQTLAINTLSTNEANISGLYNIPEVKSLSYLENYTNETIVKRGITLKPHSIWVCVDGASDQQIALSLLRTKTMGAGYNGSVEVEVMDPASEEKYIANFDRPIPVNIFVKVDVNEINVNAKTIIKNAIMDMSRGQIDGAEGFKVGTSIYPFEMSYAINQYEKNITVLNIQVSKDGVNWTSGELEIAINELAVIQEGSIEVKERAIRY